MLDLIIIAVSLVIVMFGFVVAFGAPYLPTLNSELEDGLDLLNLKPGDTMLELGSGDGKVLLAAAKRGIRCVGYEINPLLVLWTKLRCWRYRHLVTVHLQSYWSASWPEADGIYVFILQKFMPKLDTKIMQSIGKKGSVRVVAFAATFPERTHSKKLRGLYLYTIAGSGKRK